MLPNAVYARDSHFIVYTLIKARRITAQAGYQLDTLPKWFSLLCLILPFLCVPGLPDCGASMVVGTLLMTPCCITICVVSNFVLLQLIFATVLSIALLVPSVLLTGSVRLSLVSGLGL